MSASLYDVLEVQPDASPEIIRAAVRVKLNQHHPDHGGDPEVCKRVIEARDTLLDPDLRTAYDESMGVQSRVKPEPKPDEPVVEVDGTSQRECTACNKMVSIFAKRCPHCDADQASRALAAPIAKCGACGALPIELHGDESCPECGCPVIRLDGYYNGDIERYGPSTINHETVIRFFATDSMYIQIVQGDQPKNARKTREDYLVYVLSSFWVNQPYKTSTDTLSYKLNGPYLEFEFDPIKLPNSHARKYSGQIHPTEVPFTIRSGKTMRRTKFTFQQAEFDD
ncbi:MAG: J domain-containing protein [Planctomycetota bacterium]